MADRTEAHTAQRMEQRTEQRTEQRAAAGVRLAAERLSLRVSPDNRVLLAEADLCFGVGELWCIVGPNGAGKSTLLEALAGLRDPAVGRITLAGRALSDWPLDALARQRAWLPQRVQDAFGATVFDTVLLGRHPYLRGWGWESPEDREAVASAMAATGVTAMAERDIRHLSGGERQRVALAAVLAQRAPLMLCDEPLVHLDLRYQVDCLRLLQDRTRQYGDTVLFVCHDLNLARAFASHALLLDGRGHVQTGAARDVLMPDPLSRAFSFPIVLTGEGETAVLAPDLRPRAM